MLNSLLIIVANVLKVPILKHVIVIYSSLQVLIFIQANSVEIRPVELLLQVERFRELCDVPVHTSHPAFVRPLVLEITDTIGTLNVVGCPELLGIDGLLMLELQLLEIVPVCVHL